MDYYFVIITASVSSVLFYIVSLQQSTLLVVIFAKFNFFSPNLFGLKANISLSHFELNCSDPDFRLKI